MWAKTSVARAQRAREIFLKFNQLFGPGWGSSGVMKAEFVREEDLAVLHLLCIVRQRFLFCLTWNWQLGAIPKTWQARLANIFRALFCYFRLGRLHCLYFSSLFPSFERWQRCMKLVPRNPLGLVHRPGASISSRTFQYLPPTFSFQNLASININLKCL